LCHLALGLPRRLEDIMPEDSDPNVVKIIIHEKSLVPLIVRQGMAFVTAGLGIEQFQTAFGGVADGAQSEDRTDESRNSPSYLAPSEGSHGPKPESASANTQGYPMTTLLDQVRKRRAEAEAPLRRI
jgi:hypothetical protein